MLIEKHDRDGEPVEEYDRAHDDMTQMLGALRFMQRLKIDGEWFFAGEGVRLGNAGSPVCWWKLAGQDDYRVVCGDLSVRDESERPKSLD